MGFLNWFSPNKKKQSKIKKHNTKQRIKHPRVSSSHERYEGLDLVEATLIARVILDDQADKQYDFSSSSDSDERPTEVQVLESDNSSGSNDFSSSSESDGDYGE